MLEGLLSKIRVAANLITGMCAAFLGLFIFLAAFGPALAALPHSVVTVDTPHGPARFLVEVAGDEESRARGLMFRTQLASDAGMLFDFHDVRFRSFWMKNTPIPLDIVFIRPDGTISSIAANARPYSEKDIPSEEPVRAVLEINGGRAAALGIAPGERIHNAIFKNALPGQ